MRSVSLALVLVSLGVLTMGTASSATAQTGALRPFDALRPSSSEFRALELLAGPRARVVIDPDGVTLRTLAGASMAPSRASFEEGALACIDRFGPLFGLPPGATFVVQRVVSTHGFSIAHIARTIDHREVELASILVRARPDGLIDLVHVDAMPRAIAP